MGAYFKILLYILTSAFKSQGRLAAENIALRHQVLVLKRKHRGRIRLRGLDRVILGWLSQMGPAAIPSQHYATDGAQFVIPGAEQISTVELLTRKMSSPMMPRTYQRGLAGTALFGIGRA